MKFLKTHTGAMVVLAVVIVLSTLLGSHRSLVQARGEVEAQFAPIAGDLQDCLDITANLLTVGGRYLDGDALEALEGSRRELEASLDAGSRYYGIGNAAGAYRQLTERAEAVLSALDGCALTDKDADYVRGFRADLAAEQDTIARDGYNAAARRFNESVLGAFPARILGALTFVRPAESFE